MMKLQGKVAIVTGSSRGLGKAIAIGLAKEGVDIAVPARTEVETPRYQVLFKRRLKKSEP